MVIFSPLVVPVEDLSVQIPARIEQPQPQRSLKFEVGGKVHVVNSEAVVHAPENLPAAAASLLVEACGGTIVGHQCIHWNPPYALPC